MVRKNIIPKNIILVITVILLMLLIIFIVGRSYGFFTYVKKGEVVNVITINGISVNITNDDNALNLQEAEPLYDADGMQLKAFTFTMTNTSSRPLDYSIKVLNDSEKQNACLINEGTQNETTCPVLATTNIRYSYKLNNDNYSNPSNLGLDNNTIATGTIKKNQTLTYSVKMWIKSDATNDIQGNYFFGKLVIEGTEGIVTCDYDEGDYWEFNYTGDSQEFTVPCSGTYILEAWGAQGGSAYGAKGAYVKGKIDLTATTNLYVYVGGSSETSPYTTAGYNGGGLHISGTTPVIGQSASGGGATDFRYFSTTPTSSDLAWDSAIGLNSRIMVAAGGSGAIVPATYAIASSGYGGGLTGNTGNGSASVCGSSGGRQTTFGTGACASTCNASFGKGGTCYDTTSGIARSGSGGGGGYYGGGGGADVPYYNQQPAEGGGGSSYISGHQGCLAIAEGSTSEPRAQKTGCTSSSTSLECSTHYSGLYFTNTVMIDGAGYAWTTTKAATSTGMPTHDGTSTMTGNTGNGYAKITYLGD